jgi:hypothetical protein
MKSNPISLRGDQTVLKKTRHKLSGKSRKIASKYIAEEIKTKKYPLKQAIAIGISRARAATKKIARRRRKPVS